MGIIAKPVPTKWEVASVCFPEFWFVPLLIAAVTLITQYSNVYAQSKYNSSVTTIDNILIGTKIDYTIRRIMWSEKGTRNFLKLTTNKRSEGLIAQSEKFEILSPYDTIFFVRGTKFSSEDLSELHERDLKTWSILSKWFAANSNANEIRPYLSFFDSTSSIIFTVALFSAKSDSPVQTLDTLKIYSDQSGVLRYESSEADSLCTVPIRGITGVMYVGLTMIKRMPPRVKWRYNASTHSVTEESTELVSHEGVR